jgi:hypothetical protein
VKRRESQRIDRHRRIKENRERSYEWTVSRIEEQLHQRMEREANRTFHFEQQRESLVSLP